MLRRVVRLAIQVSLLEFLGEVSDVVRKVLFNTVSIEIDWPSSEKSTRFEDLNLLVGELVSEWCPIIEIQEVCGTIDVSVHEQ